ncbi:4'-phosphopantetheinyl transferase superfamily protein [Pseudomonas anguilliseptica]|uniref:4'-phosphopantetheinyl transferase superfamily protein n=1 Tax=Pseudomonas anguilliseptica TaxID=53406 RepID=A0A1H5L7Y1_PSEAG|nr:4'-phosphopantetheinyl transferase superfamily protein [Pseudomonas anguilliseptica]SEE73133.1 4'-phosphopantetheinyl transferase superfamily protein [Pseudomonas anguilliseptica]
MPQTPQGRARLLRLWTAKEAYLKGRGEGLSLPLTAIRLSAGGGWQARIEAPGTLVRAGGLHALALPAGYLGCVATPFPSPLIRFQSLAELTSSARVESPHYPEVLSPLRESTMECIQSLPSSSLPLLLSIFASKARAS